MASNEEILQEFGCPEIPFNENVTMYYPAILSSMDAARKDEAVAWEEWKRVHYIYSVIRHDMTVGFFYKKVCYSFDELYTIFKHKTVKHETERN